MDCLDSFTPARDWMYQSRDTSDMNSYMSQHEADVRTCKTEAAIDMSQYNTDECHCDELFMAKFWDFSSLELEICSFCKSSETGKDITNLEQSENKKMPNINIDIHGLYKDMESEDDFDLNDYIIPKLVLDRSFVKQDNKCETSESTPNCDSNDSHENVLLDADNDDCEDYDEMWENIQTVTCSGIDSETEELESDLHEQEGDVNGDLGIVDEGEISVQDENEDEDVDENNDDGDSDESESDDDESDEESDSSWVEVDNESQDDDDLEINDQMVPDISSGSVNTGREYSSRNRKLRGSFPVVTHRESVVMQVSSGRLTVTKTHRFPHISPTDISDIVEFWETDFQGWKFHRS